MELFWESVAALSVIVVPVMVLLTLHVLGF